MILKFENKKYIGLKHVTKYFFKQIHRSLILLIHNWFSIEVFCIMPSWREQMCFFIYVDIWCIRQHVQIVDCILMKIVPYLQYGYYSLSSLTKYVALPFVLVRIQLQLKNDQVTRTRILITEFINKLEFTLNEMSILVTVFDMYSGFPDVDLLLLSYACVLLIYTFQLTNK